MICVLIPSPLRQHCNGATELRLRATTPQEVLDQLQRCYPELYYCVCNETGRLRPHMNLFVNSKLIRRDSDWAAVLDSADVVGIFQAVSGG